MAGTKRTAEETGDSASSSATKVAKTHKTDDVKNGNGVEKKKLTADEFKSRALPLHVLLTHTPPSIRQEGNITEDGTEEKGPTELSDVDVGSIGNLTLLPSTFSTGSYGWKGSKRIVVELQAGDEDEDGHKEKVQVMLSINATVLGSKPDKAKVPAKAKKGKDSPEPETEAADEAASEEDKIRSADDLEDGEP